MFREMTEEEQALWREITDEIYESFVEVVAQARDLPLGQVRELADGRVYTGRQALELGLVDDVGTLEDAIAKAAELGGIEGEPRVIELRPTPSLRDLFYGVQTRSTVPTLDEILSWAGAPSVQLRFVGP
jgi:protease-4